MITIIIILLITLITLALIIINLLYKLQNNKSDINRLVDKVDDKLKQSNEINSQLNENINSKLGNNIKSILEFRNILEKSINNDINKLSENVENRLKNGFIDTDKTFKEVLERLAVMDKTQKNITELSKNIVGLENILNDKKSRGSFGEFRLEQLLNSIYGDSGLYKRQYKLSNGKIADTVVYINDKEKLICIDSKFPLENYKKYIDGNDTKISFINSIKKHINDISEKYIIEGETLGKAMLYLPSEAIFMEILSNFEIEIIQYAYQKNVFIVSNQTLLIYLSTINLASINYKKNKEANLILTKLNKLSTEFKRYNERWIKMTKLFDSLESEFNKVNTTSKKILTQFNDIENMVQEVNDEY